MALVKVRCGAQITLPAAIRKQLEIAEGDHLEAQVLEGGVLLKPITEAERKRALAEIRRIIDTPKWHKPTDERRGRGEDDLRRGGSAPAQA